MEVRWSCQWSDRRSRTLASARVSLIWFTGILSRKAATCGNSESMTRTCAWLAKLATASRMMERVGSGRGGEVEGKEGTGRSLCGVSGTNAGVDTLRGTGFLTRAKAQRQ